jgi:hypothetical protein
MNSGVSVRYLDANDTQSYNIGGQSRPVPSGNRIAATWVATLRLGLAVLPTIVGTSANADEPAGQLALKAPPTFASRFDWSGFYVGGHIAYGRGHVSNKLSDPDPSIPSEASMAACR